MAGWVAGEDITADKLNDRAPFTVEYQGITANTATTTTTEVIAITSGAVTFRNNRAYRMVVKALIQSSVAADHATIRVRKTDVSGTTYLDTQRIYCPGATANTLCHAENICTNTTGADVAATAVVLTYLRASGTGNVLVAASSSQVAYLHIEDIGPAADYPSATAIT